MRDAVRFGWLGAFLLLLLPATSRANPEPPALYDARVLAMGGAIGPIVDGPTGIYHNPAGLAHVDRFELNLALEPMIARLSAPYAGAGTEQDTGWVTAPLGFAGAAFRVHERITLGFGMYLSTMFGGTYEDVTRIGDCSLPESEQMTCGTLAAPTDQSLAFVVAEAAFPIAINVLPNLRIGVSLRLPYGMQMVDASSQFAGSYFQMKQQVAGFGVPGVLFGVQWDPHEQLSFSFAYRSKVRVHMEGTVDLSALVPNATDVATRTDWYVPHMFRAGLAWRPLDDRLRIVAEAKLQLHEEANRSQVLDVDFLGGMTQVVPFDWRNVFVVSAGVEYQITERWPVRVGFSRANSATPRSAVTPAQVPPKVGPGIYAGSGFHADTWSLDAALGYVTSAPTRIETPGPNCRNPALASPSGCDGEYDMQAIFAGLSFEYTLGGRDYALGPGDDIEVLADPDVDMRGDAPEAEAGAGSSPDSLTE